MTAELQLLSIGLVVIWFMWGLHRTTDIAYYIGLKESKKNTK